MIENISFKKKKMYDQQADFFIILYFENLTVVLFLIENEEKTDKKNMYVNKLQSLIFPVTSKSPLQFRYFI